MYLAELITRKKFIQEKIRDTGEYLSKETNRANVDLAVKNLLVLLDNLKSHLILIDDKNISTVVELGGSKITVANAVRLRQNTERKVDLVSQLIARTECASLDMFNLMEQRDKFNEERILIDRAIQKSDWSIIIDTSNDKTASS
ncbi:hypothetical protein DRQ25_01600 [Candidatus Fermentibacteria bacterium]|nr:MAG: hypothetical protein DRQ25_01600 [Candidatus Fermentibacteria bacterium]